MEVNCIQNQPNFGKVYLGHELQQAIQKGRIPAKRLDLIKKFEDKFEKSPITAIIGLADCGVKHTRLDAQVFYKKPGKKLSEERSFSYFSENAIKYLLGCSPKGFLNKIGREVECLEETYMLR